MLQGFGPMMTHYLEGAEVDSMKGASEEEIELIQEEFHLTEGTPTSLESFDPDGDAKKSLGTATVAANLAKNDEETKKETVETTHESPPPKSVIGAKPGKVGPEPDTKQHTKQTNQSKDETKLKLYKLYSVQHKKEVQPLNTDASLRTQTPTSGGRDSGGSHPKESWKQHEDDRIAMSLANHVNYFHIPVEQTRVSHFIK